jgi:hypothetical protein
MDTTKLLRQAYVNLCEEGGFDPPCEEYDPAGTGAGVELDGFPQCAMCGHPRIVHQESAEFISAA